MPEFKKACFCDSKRAYPKDKVLLDQKVYDAIRKEHEAQIGFDVVQTEKKHVEKEAQTLSSEAIKAKDYLATAEFAPMDEFVMVRNRIEISGN